VAEGTEAWMTRNAEKISLTGSEMEYMQTAAYTPL
jgi:hypothetical protein